MSAGQDDADRTLEATPHKLGKARQEGDLVKSADLITTATYFGVLLFALWLGPAGIDHIGRVFVLYLGLGGDLAAPVLGDGDPGRVFQQIRSVLFPVILLMLFPFVTALGGALAQRAVVFTPKALRPKLSRINPVEVAKKKYGPQGLFEFFKSLAKLILFSAVSAIFVIREFDLLLGAMMAEPRVILGLSLQIIVRLLALMVAISLCIGVLDYLWQFAAHRKRNRMTQKEVRDEMKEAEGDPHFKQKRMDQGQRLIREQILPAVETADVVVVNPTHFAVALKWSRRAGSAPECVAKGRDHIALAIKHHALAHGVPVREDAATARALFATTEVGQEVSSALYRPVAAAIRFAENMRLRAKKGLF